MTSNDDSRSAPVLDPLERVSEVLFGLIMALSITGTIEVAGAGDAAIEGLLAAALGCNLAWGFVDAVLYVVSQIVDRGRRRTALRRLAGAQDDQAVRGLLAQELPAPVVQLFDVGDLQQLRSLAAHGAAAVRVRMQWRDLRGAIGVFLLVTAATFPVVVPYLVVDDALLARRVSNVVSMVSVYLCGHVVAVHAGARPVRFGMAMVGISAVLVAAVELLGG